MSDREHPNGLPRFLYNVDHPIDVWLLAVKQMPQLSLRPPSFRDNRAAIGIQREQKDRLFQLVVPASSSV
jgi:hypothetical protein